MTDGDEPQSNHPNVIQASYADLKIVKTRGVVQLVFEVPLRDFNHALGVLGGAPLPDKEIWVAIARLHAQVAVEAAAESLHESQETQRRQEHTPRHNPETDVHLKRDWWEMPPAARAAIDCRDVRFQQWLKDLNRIPLATEAEATAYVRRIAGGHRSNLGKMGFENQTQTWEKVDRKYREFLQRQRDEAAR